MYAFLLSYILALAVRAVFGWRVPSNDEIEGLDITEHGESGYNLTEPLGMSYSDASAEPVAAGR